MRILLSCISIFFFSFFCHIGTNTCVIASDHSANITKGKGISLTDDEKTPTLTVHNVGQGNYIDLEVPVSKKKRGFGENKKIQEKTI